MVICNLAQTVTVTDCVCVCVHRHSLSLSLSLCIYNTECYSVVVGKGEHERICNCLYLWYKFSATCGRTELVPWYKYRVARRITKTETPTRFRDKTSERHIHLQFD